MSIIKAEPKMYMFDKDGKVPTNVKDGKYRIRVDGDVYSLMVTENSGVNWETVCRGSCEKVKEKVMQLMPGFQFNLFDSPSIAARRKLAYYYFDKNGASIRSANGAFIRVSQAGVMQIQVEKYKWVRVMTNVTRDIEANVSAYLVAVQYSAQYFTENWDKTVNKDEAKFKLFTYEKDSYLELYAGKTLVSFGAASIVNSYIDADKMNKSDRSGSTKEDNFVDLESDDREIIRRSTNMSVGYTCNVIKVVESRITDLSYAFIDNYLYMCVCRNRRIATNRIIDTRLRDSLDYPVYILDCGDFDKAPNLRDVRVVDSLVQAKSLYPDLMDTQLPQPLQWSNNYLDYIWNPSIPVMPLSQRAQQHIILDRIDRFPQSLRGLSAKALMTVIKQSLENGIEKANIDVTYAIPAYSRKYDTVSMLLPICVPTYNGGKPIAALLLNKTKTLGYEVATVVTIDMAIASCQAFKDPKSTWLREVI